MRRLLLASAAAVCIGASTTLVAVTAAGAVPARDDNATVCATTATTVTDGMDEFVGLMDKVSSQATAGDLVAAEQSVKDAGTKLISLGGEVRKDAATADDAQLKGTVEKLAGEFETLGKSLTGLASVAGFSTKNLDAVAEEMTAACGGTPLPEVSPSAIPTGLPSAPLTGPPLTGPPLTGPPLTGPPLTGLPSAKVS